MPRIRIDAVDDPRLAPYRDVKQSNLTRWSGLTIVEGQKVVERLLASDWQTESLLVSERKVDLLPAETSCDVFVVADALARELVGYNFHAGFLACARRPPLLELSALLQQPDAATDGRQVLVACSRITDPDNLGSLIRIASAFGATGLLLGEKSCDPFSRRTIRVSMGTVFSLAIRESVDLLADLRQLQQHRYQVIAAALHPQGVPLSQLKPAEQSVLLLGNEADGLSANEVHQADIISRIPMSNGTDSLNVAIAAAVFLHHLRFSDE